MGSADAELTATARVGHPAGSGIDRVWLVVLGVGLAAVVAYFAAPAAHQQAWYLGIGATSVVAILVGIRVHRPSRAGGWYFLVAANACFVGGDQAADVYQAVTGHDVSTPSIADALYLAGYPLLIAAVFMLARAAGIAATRERRIDAALITIGAIAAAWQPLVEPSATDQTVSLLGRLVTASYPVMDMGVLYVLVSAVISARTSTVAQRLLGLSIGCMLVSDVVYTLQNLAGSYADGDAVDAGWLLSYVLFAVAALHPSMGSVRPVPARTGFRHSRRWTVVVSVASFSPLILLMTRSIAQHDVAFAAPVGFSIATLAFIGLRVALLFERVRAQTGLLAEQAESLRSALTAEQALEADLRHRAYHDDLTGLPNRAWIRDRLDAALAQAADAGSAPGRRRVAFCLADLDRFKTVNDTLGHRTGDEVLVAVGHRLGALTDDGVVVARLGGDEFACVLSGADPATAARAAQQMVDVLREPVEVGGGLIQLSSSVGLAISDDTSSGAELLARADIAMYAAKNGGRDHWRHYEPAMGEYLAEQNTVTNAFPDALRRHQFSVVFQPVFAFADGGLKGFESLVRWNHPTLGPISPQRFIPLAEETGFVVPLGRWVLETACHAAAGWPPVTTVAVNLSARQLADPTVVAVVAAALDASGLQPDRLTLEVTESAVMEDVVQAARTVADLKALGVAVAIDDFGTGHSSLAHLRDLPIDILKIDRSFVSPLTEGSATAFTFVRAIVGLARALGMTTVAEGVESLAQYEALRALECDTVQGFLTGRPLAAGAAAQLAETAAVTSRPHWSLHEVS